MNKNIKILVVDDIFSNRLLLSSSIETIGYYCKSVDNGKKAIDTIIGEQFDLVFMDIEMPVMNGIETTRYIRNNIPYPLNKIPVIALSAHNPADYSDDMENAGFNEFLPKPYSYEKLVELIEKYVKK